MNRDEYLNQLKNCIQALPIEEQNEALDYYYNYFEDANDDEKVISDLGEPEKLAEEIKNKFACVPATKENKSFSKEEDYSKDSNIGDPSALEFSFNQSDIKNLDFSLGIAEIVMIPGDCFKVETRGVDSKIFRCQVTEQGTLVIQNTHKMPSFKFLSHENPSHKHPRILISIPLNVDLEIVRISVGAGSLISKGTKFSCKSGKLEVSAGNLNIENLYGGNIDFRCGMGKLVFSGITIGQCNVDCGLGSIELRINGKEEDYSADAKVGFGDFRFNSQKKGGIGDLACHDKRSNHFSVNCGLGCVKINIQ